MNNFIRENLTEEEIDLILIRHAEVKRVGFGKVEVIVENFKIVKISKAFSENPAVLKGLYRRE